MERQLYPGIAFSPQATLTNNIGAADTIIEVSDVAAFPAAPNLATIGTDVEGETILYTAQTDTALSGCQRGVEGTAKAWKAGELIGRNFTAKDHADLIADVRAAGDAAVSALSEAEAAQGAADAAIKDVEDIRQRLTNPKLLDNWYFADPINQRGASGKISTPGYFIDRWKLTSGTVTISSSGITLNGTIQQKLETAPDQTVTATYLTNSGVVSATYTSSTKTFSITANNVLIRAAKLELGSTQTLAHQASDGNWALNDPPPNKALELAKCQRYYLPLTQNNRYPATYRSTSNIDFSVPIPTTMRTTPTLIGDDFAVRSNNASVSGFSFSITGAVSSNQVSIRANKNNHGLLNDASICLTVGAGAALDADL